MALYEEGVGGGAIDGVALQEQAVADVLEVAVDADSVGASEQDDRTREADVAVVSALHAPLPEEVACLTAFLTCGQQEEG